MGRGENADGLNMSTAILASPNSFVLAGAYTISGNSVDDRSSYGRYWANSPNGRTTTYYLVFNSKLIYPKSELPNGYGFSLRCLAR